MGVVKRQSIKNTISSYLGILIGFASLIVVQPKFLSPETIGLTRALFAFSTLISGLIPLGAWNIIIKYFPRFFDRDKKHHGFLGFIMLYPIIGSFITFILLLVFKDAIIAKYSVHSALFGEYFFWVFPFSFFIGMSIVLSFYLAAINKSTIPAYMNDIVVRILYIGLIFLFYFDRITLPQFVLGYVSIYAFQFLVLISYLFWEDKPSFKFNTQKLKEENFVEMTKFGIVAWGSSFAQMGFVTIDAVILGAYGLHDLGVYTIVAFIPTIIQTPIIAIDRITSAKIGFDLAHNNLEEIKKLYYQSCRYLFALAGLLTVGINVNIASLLSLLKPEYLAAASIVPIASIGYLLNMAGGVNATILIYAGKKRETALVQIGAFVIMVTLDLLLIPSYGMIGAAMGIALTYLIYGIIKWLWLWKKFGFQPYDFNFLKNALLIAVVWTFVAWIPNFENPIVNILFKGSLATAAYIGGILALNILPDWKTFLPESIQKKLP